MTPKNMKKDITEYMKMVWERIVADARVYGIAVFALPVYAALSNLLFHAVCPLIVFCGIPCPGCGISRATAYFMTGRWSQAWQMNPMIFPIVLAALYFGWNRYLLGRKARGIKAVIAVLVVMLVIVYIVRMCLYFPNRVPYVYTADNVLAHFMSFVRQHSYVVYQPFILRM